MAIRSHGNGRAVLSAALREQRRTCGACGFEGSIPDGAWETHAGRTRAGHLRYRLVCPDCRSVEEVTLDIP
jgi:hypothetical protein